MAPIPPIPVYIEAQETELTTTSAAPTRRGGYAPIHYSSTAGDRSRSPSDPGQLMPSPKEKMEVALGMEEWGGGEGGWLYCHSVYHIGPLEAPFPECLLNNAHEVAAPHSGYEHNHFRHFVPPDFDAKLSPLAVPACSRALYS
ncbi:hypothetical protein B0H34DRAFT_804978 [Crassisporium funariophilum]|nr:hypothetical protein B0H34DRAFT_804978 [Crassisporium funariophilum]